MKGSAAFAVIFVLLVGAGSGATWYFHGSPSPTTISTSSFVTTSASTPAPNLILQGKNVTLDAFVQLIKDDYVTGTAFGLLGVCTTIQMYDDTMTLPANPTGATSLHIVSGTVRLCPIGFGVSGVAFDFQGQAVWAEGGTLTRLSLTYQPQMQTTTATTIRTNST